MRGSALRYRLLTLLMVIALWLPTPELGGAEEVRPLPSYQAFLSKATIKAIALSPGGRQLVYGERQRTTDALWLMDLQTNQTKKLLVTQDIGSLYWSEDESSIFVERGDTLASVDIQSGQSRLIWRRDGTRSERFLGVDHTRPNHILIHRALGDDRHALLALDTFGQETEIFNHEGPIIHRLLGGDGKLRFLKYIEGETQIIRSLPEGEEWLRCDYLDPCHLLGLGPDGQGFYLRGRLEGDTWGLYLLQAPGEPILVHRDPRGLSDLAQTLWLDPAGPAKFVRYDMPTPKSYGLDAESQGHIEAIQRALGERHFTLDPSPQGRWLIREFGPRLQHPRYHLYNPEDGELRELLGSKREAGLTLDPADLSPKHPIQYRARDGMTLHGYVSLPKVPDLTQAPVVIQVHGGPWSQNRHTYGTQAQFLVSRGYVVWEPNFRASTGYGQAYMEGGRGEFGRGQVEGDIFDGLSALSERGWGDTQNVAILGHSFGGFATLSAAANQGHRIKVGIASAAPIDLLRAMDDVKGDAVYHNGMPLREVALSLVLPENMETPRHYVRARSPEALMAQTSAPLVILAGAQDEKINLVHVEQHALALEELGKDVSLLVDPIAGHSFDDPLLREAWFYLAESVLSRHLGGATKANLRPELAAYLRRTLAIEGASLEGWDGDLDSSKSP